MIKLIAVDYSDAYALVELEEKKYAIRPPFKQKGQSISQEVVDKAIALYGFSPAEENFSNWNELISFLTSKAIESRKELGHERPDSEKIRSLVKKAPLEQIEKYLYRIENELIPNSEANAAESILLSLLKNPFVRKNDAVFDKCTNLLERCNEVETGRNKLFEFNYEEMYQEKFPYAARQFSSDYMCGLIESVRHQGQIVLAGN